MLVTSCLSGYYSGSNLFCDAGARVCKLHFSGCLAKLTSCLVLPVGGTRGRLAGGRRGFLPVGFTSGTCSSFQHSQHQPGQIPLQAIAQAIRTPLLGVPRWGSSSKTLAAINLTSSQAQEWKLQTGLTSAPSLLFRPSKICVNNPLCVLYPL